MPDRAEIESSLYGVWRLARLDPAGLRFLNLTVDGFWRSFVVIPLLLPFQLLLAWLVADTETLAEAGAAAWLATRGVVFVVAWLAFLASMAPLSRLLRLSHNYPTYVIAMNWATVVQMVVVMPIGLLFGLALLPDALAMLLLMVAWLAIMAYDFVITRLALGADALTAAGVVVYAVVLELVIEGAADTLLS